MPRKNRQIQLQVFLSGDRVGLLTRNISGGLEFTYATEWLQTTGALPVSQSLPLRELPYRGDRVTAYFDNLLPDNEEIRRRLALKLALGGTGTFDLLAALGRDCVGALQFVPEGEILRTSAPVQGEAVSSQEIASLLLNLKGSPLGLDRETDFRISVAGVQEKTALLMREGKWYRPKGATPTSHILKPAIGLLPNGIDMSGSVQNEWFCLKLARHFGLDSVQAEIQKFGGVECLVVERFDRAWSQDRRHLRRIPQEDLCQALGIPWPRKYESDGGPGMVTLMDFLNASDRRDRDRQQFMRAQLVFFLLGAVDGHAKNFSITLAPTGFRLAPIYDVISIFPALAKRQVEPKQVKLAMSVGDNRHYRLAEIQRRHWEQTARKAGFPPKELQTLIQSLVDRAGKLEILPDHLERNLSPTLVHPIMKGIKKQIEVLDRG